MVLRSICFASEGWSDAKWVRCYNGIARSLLRKDETSPIMKASFLRWSETVLLASRPLFGLLYQPRMMDDYVCGAVGGMISRESQSTRRKPAPLPLCSPQIPHDLTWARTLAVAKGTRLLSIRATATPPLQYED
jgi:hypothetical protein